VSNADRLEAAVRLLAEALVDDDGERLN